MKQENTVPAGHPAIWTHFKNFWQQEIDGQIVPVTRKEAVGNSLAVLADCFDRKVTSLMLNLYLSALDDCTINECITAFVRVALDCKFWPTPAQMRTLAGRQPAGDLMDNAASNSFRAVIAALRDFPMLTHHLGAICRKEDEQGRILAVPEREDDTHPPDIGEKARKAIAYLGFGDLTAGLKLLSDHPSLEKWAEDSAQWRQNALKASDELERRYLAAWKATA